MTATDDNLNIASHAPRRDPGLVFASFKRMLDIVGAALGLVLCAPILAACAAWIKLADRGPVFYSQWRVGRDGWLFRIYKLRTMAMRAEACGDARFAASGDPRILRGCAWMRRSHADELPQLLNILLGHMSLVGPRPERPEIMEQLRRDIPGIDRRLEMKPGLTGLAQVRNGYTNDVKGTRRKLAYDLQYLRKRSIRNDLSLLLRTIPRVWDQSAL
jgi:lipopolysaccharide/colanic/teichoic acid biosynthesis glycosyltransferase